MSVIKLKLPAYAADLIAKTTPQAVYDDMIANNGLPFSEMVTFGHVISPIINNETGAEEAYVVHWHNEQVSVTLYNPGDEFLPLVGVTDWGNQPPTCREALDIFYSHVSVT